MTSSTLRLVAAALAVESGLAGAPSASARAGYAPGGNWSFGQITATGGTLNGVDVSGAVVQMNGLGIALSAVAAQAAGAVPMSMAGQPRGWPQLDGSGMVPVALLPGSVTSPVDATARAAAAGAQSVASQALSVGQSAEPAAAADKASGFAQLDPNGLVPVALLPGSVTSPVDATARAAAAGAQSVASQALSVGQSAEPAAAADKASGFAQLDPNGLVPVALLPGSVTSPVDATARAAAAGAQSVASNALTLASSSVQVAKANLANGWLQLNASGLIPTAAMPPSGVAAGACAKAVFDATGRATGCTTLAGSDIPLDGTTIAVNANGALSAIGGSGIDATARSEATSAQSVAAAAIPASQIGVSVAGLDAAKSLSGNISAAASDAVQRTFAQHWSDTINAADYGVDCDAGIVVAFSGTTGSNTITSTHYVFGPGDVGRPLKGGYQWGQWTATITGYGPMVGGVSSATVSTPPTANATGDAGYMTYVTDNSAAMQAVYKHYLASPKGAMVSWPIGKCNFSQTQTWNVPTSLRFAGMGIGATQFVMTAPNTDAFHFIVGGAGNQPDLTLDNFTVSKSDPNQNFVQDQTANRFANKAINVEAQGDLSSSAGLLVVSHVMIEGQNHTDTSHGWNVGLEVNSFARPVIEFVNVKNAGIADGWNNAYVNAPNPLTNEAAAIPASILPGQGDDFWLHGSPSNNGTVATSEVVGTASIPVNSGASIGAGNSVEDVALNQMIGTAYSVSSGAIVVNASTASAAATKGAGTVAVTGNGGNANLQSGSIYDVTTGASLGTATLSGTTLTFGTGGIASAVSNGDVLSSGVSSSVSSGDELSNSSSYVIDSAFEHNGSDGGNVGLDIEDFQGGYVTDYDAVYGGYEIRSEHNDPTSVIELMEVEDSLFNGFLMDIDVAYAGWFGVANNDFLHSFGAPFFQAIWNHGGGLWTIAGNQLSAPGQANASGIAFTSDGPDSFGGFPESVTGNVGFSFTGTCLYTDAHYSAVIASSNSFEGCGTYVTDANGSNDYANNIFQYPTMQWTPSTGTEFPSKVLLGTYANAGVLTVQDFPTTLIPLNQFVLDSSQGTMTETMNRTHATAWGGFFGYSGPGTLVLATGSSSNFPPVTSGGVEIYGRLLCANAGAFMAGWSVLGHYNASGPSGAGVFTPDTDTDTLYAIGGTTPRFSLTPQLLPGTSPGIEVVIGSGTPAASCTAKLDELVAQ